MDDFITTENFYLKSRVECLLNLLWHSILDMEKEKWCETKEEAIVQICNLHSLCGLVRKQMREIQ